jgi:Protein of unknown function (DUF3147)
MIVSAKLGALRGIKVHEFAVRFLFGGLCTVAAGLIAKRFGPSIGGLFLAFPAIFPASASLIEKHEKQHKQRIGRDGTKRGRAAASIDAAGASLGALGLIAFAVVVWRILPQHNSWLVISSASVAWFAVSICGWLLRKSRVVHAASGSIQRRRRAQR